MIMKTKKDLKFKSFPYEIDGIDDDEVTEYLNEMADAGWDLFMKSLALESDKMVTTFVHKKNREKAPKTETTYPN